MLQLSKSQYKQLCTDCAGPMMTGSGHGGEIEGGEFQSREGQHEIDGPNATR